MEKNLNDPNQVKTPSNEFRLRNSVQHNEFRLKNSGLTFVFSGRRLPLQLNEES
jgi:hypothetical protein